MQTNSTIEFYKVVKSYTGAITDSFVGSYDAWIEHGAHKTFKVSDGIAIEVGMSQGSGILWEELPLYDDDYVKIPYYIVYDHVRFDVDEISTFKNNKGVFHHMEFTYK